MSKSKHLKKILKEIEEETKPKSEIEEKVYHYVGQLSASHHDHYFREDMSVDIQAEKKRIAEALIGLFQSDRMRLVERVEDLKKVCSVIENDEQEHCECMDFNEALDQVIDLLKP